MNNKNIIIAGAIAVGLYLFSQTKTTAQKVAQRIRSTATQTIRQRTAPSTIRQRTAQKIAQKIGKKVAQKIAPKRIGQPTTQAARIAAAQRAAAQRAAAQKVDISKLPVQQLRYMIAHAAAQKKTGKEVAALKAEVSRREAAYIAAVRKAAAQKIGKKIGKRVAQKIPLNVRVRRAVIAQHFKRQRPQIQRPRPNKKQIASRLFPGAEKSRIIPYSESSRHSYYGPKSHKVLNPGYMEKRYKADYNTIEAYDARKLRELLESRKPWQT